MTTVTISSGTLTGTPTAGVSAFLGVPYAAPAVGVDRFRAPAPAAAWQGTRDATTHGPTALQSPYPAPFDQVLPSSVSPGDEYLNANIWTPDVAATGLPVMVWIHGGAFVRGANSIATYDGSAIARDGVVVVGVNYRLGAAGFSVLPDAPTNLGLRDQVFALEWVRDNIAAFGGDPGNITIFGESAGGMSVATLLASPAAQYLFHKAIVQSGNGAVVATMEDAAKVTAEVARRLEVPATAAAFGAASPDDLLAAQEAVAADFAADQSPQRWGASTIRAGLGAMSHVPVIDGDLVPGLPVEGVATCDKPLLAGTTSEEFRLFTVPTGVAAMITPETLPFVLARYGWDRSTFDRYAANRPNADAGEVITAMLTDVAFRVPTAQLARAHTAAPTYVYEFAWRSAVAGLGAAHAMELPFVFDNLSGASGMVGTDAPAALAARMRTAWTDFAKTGNPGWPAYDDSRTVMMFDVESAVVVDPRGDELDLWL